MGYGIKLLITQRHFIPKMLRGEGEECDWREEVIYEADLVHKVQDELFRLSGWTIDFIASCKTIFTIFEDEDGDVWDNIYKWKYKYTQMSWDDLKIILEPLVEKLLDENYSDWSEEEEKKEIIDALEMLISVKDITTTFVIS
jgi:hypothetical protein